MAARKAPSSTSSGDEASQGQTWIQWFCSQEGNEFLCEVDERYILDNFNLYGLKDYVGEDFKKALDVILDKDDTQEAIDEVVERLYGLIHARFILTKRGQDNMRKKYRNCIFGLCPLLSCEQQPLLPVGLKDSPGLNTVMVYCPRCNQVMHPSISHEPDVDLDGAYFGSTFPHLFLMQFPELRPPQTLKVPVYIPRVFGYRVRIPTPPPSLIQDPNRAILLDVDEIEAREQRTGHQEDQQMNEGNDDE